MTTGNKITEFIQWVGDAAPGDKFCYHIGNLMADRVRLVVQRREGLPPITTEERVPEVDLVAKAVWARYLKGDVLLVQKRVLPEITNKDGQSIFKGQIGYLCIKRRPVRGDMAREIAGNIDKIAKDNAYVG